MREDKELRKALREHFQIPGEIERQCSMADWDLWYGPFPAGGWDNEDEPLWLGFSKTVDAITEGLDDCLHEIWFDSDSGEIFDKEPDLDYGDYGLTVLGHMEVYDIKKLLFGRELAEYI